MNHPLPARLHIFILTLALILPTALPLLADSPDSRPAVSVYHEPTGQNGYQFLADNNLPVPAFIRLNFPILQNYKADRKLPVELVLPARAKRVAVVGLTPLKGRKLLFKSSYSYAAGNPLNTRPDSGQLYLLPFAHGSKFKVGQGFNGKTTHSGQNRYAIDFDMPEGTPVFAARDGIVAEIKQDSNRTGPKPEDNNYLLIYQSDGTFGNYVHLQQNGVVVQVGDRVKAGELIAHSGNTGFSSGPHLHFDVRIPLKDGSRQSIPIKFLNYDGTALVPLAGLYYYAFHPGKDKFPVVLGRLLHNEEFRNWAAKVPPTAAKAELRLEQQDDTIVVFIRNPSARTIAADIALKFKNLLSSNGRLIKLQVPAQTERFVTLLNPKDPLRATELSSELTYRYQE